MTRINANIPVERLCDEHLLAEHREIKRIPNTITSGKAKLDNIPSTFKLGSGHVKFFYNKLKFLHNRYKTLYKECVKRGFEVTNYDGCWDDIPDNLYRDYNFTSKDNQLIVERIAERLSGMKNIHFNRVKISSLEATKLLVPLEGLEPSKVF